MEILVQNTEGLAEAARQVLAKAAGRRILLFYGAMGVGKTTLIKAICERLGVSEATSSPTFSIVNAYESEEGTVYHFDFYRLRSEQEAFDMGYEEYFYSGNYCFVEWPEKIAGLIPEDAVCVRMSLMDDETRQISVS